MPASTPRLRVHHPPGTERVVVIERNLFKIGRRPDNDLVIAEKDISRLQAVIVRDGDAFYIEDKGSTFGTAVNGVTAARQMLSNRDVVTMGRERQVEMIFLLDDRMSRILDHVGSRPSGEASADEYRNLSILLEISKGFNAMVSLQDMLELTLDAVLDVAGAERGIVMLKDEEGRLQVRAARSLTRERLDADRTRYSGSIVDEVARTGEPRFLTDVRRDTDVRARASVEELSLRSILCLPLRVLPADRVTRPPGAAGRSGILGVIYADSSQGSFSRAPVPEMTKDLLSSIAIQAGLALENFHLRQEDLERRLTEREMEREMDRLREIDRIKSALLSNVSHELRTPLTAIKGSIENMLDGLAGDITEKQRRYLARAGENAEHLARLINDLLDLERIESGRLSLAPRHASVTRLLEDAAESLRPLAERRGVLISIEPPREDLAIHADRDRLMQVLFNLVGNSLKFTAEGGHVVLEAARAAEGVRITVSDTGIGIPERELERIFDRFYQVEGAEGAKTEGTGLGLPIARSLVELHGGRLWAERPASGSRFVLTLPIKADAPSSPPEGATA